MSGDKQHSRVTPQGRAMGKSAARLAELGRNRLAEMGLADVKGPGLRDEMCKTCACQAGSVPNGCNEKRAAEMLASLRVNAKLIRAEALLRGKPELFHEDQTAFQ